MRERDPSAAGRHLAAAREAAPGSDDVRLAAARLHLLQGDRASARTELERISRRSPARAEADRILRTLAAP